jgi:hypothetical protein
MLRKISTWFQHAHPHGNANAYQQTSTVIPHCSATNCQHAGTYKAPREDGASVHHNPDSWYWFCKAHAREYNAQWRYYDGMTTDEAYASYRDDLSWNRPTWPMGAHVNSNAQNVNYSGQTYHPQDPFAFFHDNRPHAQLRQPVTADHSAMQVLGLTYPFSFNQLQFAYRTMVKRHHPDLNKGDSKSEEIFKHITESYHRLKKIAV